ncbi:MAG: cadmium-translocating P-type ATPase [Lachnospiraceae bacterium]|nr:cadmium-translocating P-type ATPase [Lachnospiraceae bacterium]
MTKKQRKMLIRIIMTAVIFFPLLMLDNLGFMAGFPIFLRIIVFLIPYGIIGYDVIRRACINIRHGQVFDENFLMMLATAGAIGVGEYSEAVAVMLFYQVGELFQSYAVGKSRNSISSMLEMIPEYVNIETDSGIEKEDPEEVTVGSIIVIMPGERVPLDGIVIEGESMLDTSALTGESVQRRASEGDEIYSGCINGKGILKVRTTKEYDDSMVAKILELVETAGEKKAKTENFITRFARYYTPVVTISAILLVIFGPLVSGGTISVSTWIFRACTFLVVSCPCALVISVPLGFFGGIGASSRHGILVKGSNYLELASKINTIVFDKTGTLTKGEFKVSRIVPFKEGKAVAGDKEMEYKLLSLAAQAEGYSTHPIALSVLETFKENGGVTDASRVSDVTEEPGLGIRAKTDGRIVLVGNEKLLNKYGIEHQHCEEKGTVVHVCVDNIYAGFIVISDRIKEGAAEGIREIKKAGVKRCLMLTGDREEAAEAVAQKLEIDEYFASLMPGDKVLKVENLIKDNKKGEYTAFVGDGINDAPVLARADIGIAMGSMGSDAAIEAADIVLMDDNIRKIALMIGISGKTMRIVKQNIVFALSVKIGVLILSALGYTNMWAAVFADVGVCVLAILNSMRTLNYKKI